ncbi:FAD-linked oxidoreductase [Colletotrichum sp. SAR11_59]|nr:FAD-linked oxidoreductase [Colletotrichum sp. SAR11_59]
MEVLTAGVAWALNQTVSTQKILGRLGLASLLAHNVAGSWTELAAGLSPQASILLPDEPSFDSSISRWREWHAPSVGAVVNVFTESDIQATIRYANAHEIPFLARSGGHGATEALQDAKDAIMIDVRGWNQVEIAEDGKTATLGGGASVKTVVNALWAAGKQTKETNPDLFWALQGAGHNFGIVTEWKYRVYDIKNNAWGYSIFIFLAEHLEEVMEVTNKMMETQPPEIAHWIYFINLPDIDPERPIIWYAIINDGSENGTVEYAKPLFDIEHVSVESGSTAMPDLAVKVFTSEDSLGCAKGNTGLRYPIGLKRYDLPAIRKVFDDMTEMSLTVPELAGSFFMLEGYSTQGVKAIDEKSSAFPHRDDDLLVTPYVVYKPNASLDALAQDYGERLRGHLLKASDDPERLRAYVNYAHGDESLESVYGWEEWRLEKLRALKKKWDPENRMRFYNPIV